MDESALERYFDRYIANDNILEVEEEMEEGLNEQEEAFLRLLSDELLTLVEDNKDSSRLNYNSHNATAAPPVPERSSTPKQVPPQVPVTQRPTLTIQSVTSVVKLGCPLDLNFIAHNAWNVEYRKNARSAIMRLRKLLTTAQIYKTGTIVCIGARSKEQCKLAARKFARIVQKMGIPIRFLNFKIKNIIAHCQMSPIRLERLALHKSISYEQELFSGALYTSSNITATIYASGKICFTGANEVAEYYKVLDDICSSLSDYKAKQF